MRDTRDVLESLKEGKEHEHDARLPKGNEVGEDSAQFQTDDGAFKVSAVNR